MYHLHLGNGSNGLLWGFAVLALVLWMLGIAFQPTGAFIHALLVVAVALLVVNFCSRTPREEVGCVIPAGPENAGTMTHRYRRLLFEFFVLPAVAAARRLAFALGFTAQPRPKLKVGK